MMDNQVPAVLVARYLKANHYDQTLEAFLKESNLSPAAAETNPGDWTLEKVVEEKIQFDVSLKYEKHGNELDKGWSQPYPSQPEGVDRPFNKNILCVRGHPSRRGISITTAGNDFSVRKSFAPYQSTGVDFHADSPVLATNFITGNYIASTCMSGKLTIHNWDSGKLCAENRVHAKWAVDIATFGLNDINASLIATAGWDQKVYIYVLQHAALDANTSIELTPSDTLEIATNPISLLFVKYPDNGQIYLVLSRQDSSFLYYYKVSVTPENLSTCTVEDAGRQNLAPHSNAWVAFTPSALALHPTDSGLVAIATSHLPHLKLIIVRLLFPGESTSTLDTLPMDTPAAVVRRDLAIQDREDGAIKVQVSTHAPQTPYSTPQIVWRPDGSGVWVNGDDGVIRGVEAKTGKVVAYLKGHEIGSKVRTLWAGLLKDASDHDREVLVSGGFDRTVFVWTIPINP